MKFGVSLFPLRPNQIVEVALKAEELGYDSVWLGEHVVTPMQHDSSFPYAGEQRSSHDNFHGTIPFYDPYAVLGYLAALTENLKLAVSISIVPLHDPFHLARSVTTLDLFSNGRFLFGMGGGWLKEEFDILGRDFQTRGKRFNETIEVMTQLFTNEVTEYSGETMVVPPVGMAPKPQSQPHPPFIFGGHSRAALRRTAKYGDGWLATEATPEEIAGLKKQLDEFRAEEGREKHPCEISCHINESPSPDLIERYAEAGVERLVIRNWPRGRDAVDCITRLAEEIGPF